jgi:hypothetical protein
VRIEGDELCAFYYWAVKLTLDEGEVRELGIFGFTSAGRRFLSFDETGRLCCSQTAEICSAASWRVKHVRDRNTQRARGD